MEKRKSVAGGEESERFINLQTSSENVHNGQEKDNKRAKDFFTRY